MAIEPNKKMDDLLKRYARQRRGQAGSPFELSAGARNRLQAEIARTFQETRSKDPSWLMAVRSYWPRLAFGSLAVILAGTGILWLSFHQDNELKLAQSQETNLFLFDQAAVEPRTNTSDSDGMNERLRGFKFGEAVQPNPSVELPTAKPLAVAVQQAEPEEKTFPPAANGLAPVRPKARVDVAMSEPREDRLIESMASNAARFSRGLTPAPESPNAAMAQQLGIRAQQNSTQALRFQQINSLTKYRQNLNSPPVPPVLTSFEMQLAGQNVRILDADASVYDGNVQEPGQDAAQLVSEVMKTQQATVAGRTTTALAQANGGGKAGGIGGGGGGLGGGVIPANQAGPSQAGQNADQGFSFRVSGMNRTLNQNVVFTGQFQPARGQETFSYNQTAGNAAINRTQMLRRFAQPAPQRGIPSAQNENSISAAAGAAQSNSVMNNSQALLGRIEGKASLGNDKSELTIEAQQIGP